MAKPRTVEDQLKAAATAVERAEARAIALRDERDEVVRAAIASGELSQRAIARAARMTHTSVQRILSGDRSAGGSAPSQRIVAVAG